MQPFTLLIKPSGSDCNMDCRYCFYKDRAPEVGQGRQRMSDEVLERMTKDYMELGFPAVSFSWQGGEPTLMGLDFYKRAVELQQKYSGGRQISNSLQTNAILLDENWCRFLHDNKFLAGISIDGPRELHDYYRVDHSGKGTFDRVTRAIEVCRQHSVEFNALILLNNRNAGRPDELLDFFIEEDIRYLQFIPCVELDGGGVTDFSITPREYGEFLCRSFEKWCEIGPQNLSIREFESILTYCVTGQHTICTFARQCTDYIVVEHNGDCFVCDFFVEPKWRLGNIFETPIEKLAGGDKKRAFARTKQNLSDKCLLCRHLDVCRGGCVKNRIAFDGHDVKKSYFCESYKKFFDYAMPRFMQIAANLSVDSAVRERQS